jgi:pilus assembly protein CpaB
MTRTVKARTLLRPDDLGWTMLPPAEVPTGAYRRGQAAQADFAGAVVRGDLRPGDVLTADRVVKSSEPGFLPAVLGDDKRAMSIAVNPSEGAAGLIVPGDHVDVVLTQNLAEAGVPVSRRSVGETVLSDLRVIAVDQNTANEPRPRANEARGEQRQGRTVTLEVSVRPAETLMVAQQLGKIQLTLRNAGEARGLYPSSAEPTWGTDVSAALRSLDSQPTITPDPVRPAPDAVKKRTITVDVLHGERSETLCFDASGQAVAGDCSGNAAARPAVPGPGRAPPTNSASGAHPPGVPALLPPALTRSL